MPTVWRRVVSFPSGRLRLTALISRAANGGAAIGTPTSDTERHAFAGRRASGNLADLSRKACPVRPGPARRWRSNELDRRPRPANSPRLYTIDIDREQRVSSAPRPSEKSPHMIPGGRGNTGGGESLDALANRHQKYR